MPWTFWAFAVSVVLIGCGVGMERTAVNASGKNIGAAAQQVGAVVLVAVIVVLMWQAWAPWNIELVGK